MARPSWLQQQQCCWPSERYHESLRSTGVRVTYFDFDSLPVPANTAGRLRGSTRGDDSMTMMYVAADCQVYELECAAIVSDCCRDSLIRVQHAPHASQ